MTATPPKPKDELLAVAARLSRAAPNTWVEFIAALEAYKRVRMDACVQAPSDRILITQGKAQQCVELLDLLSEAAKQK